MGSNSDESIVRLFAFYCKILNVQASQFKVMTPLEAEIAKLTLNCYVTMKITFANQIGNLCHRLGFSPRRILDAVGSDTRVGKKYFKSGLGYGGPCFPRDNKALTAFMKQNKSSSKLFEVVDFLNEMQVLEILERIWKMKHFSVGFESLSYKKGSDITECSQLKTIHDYLKEQGYRVKIGKGQVNLNHEGII
jgi:UDPglucose 6-dehydrogenase